MCVCVCVCVCVLFNAKITAKIYKSSGLHCEDLSYYSLLGYDTVLLSRWVPTSRVCGAVNKDCTKLHLFNYYC